MSWSGIKHEPEIITVVFTDITPHETEGRDGDRVTSMNQGAYVFDEHGCEIGVFDMHWHFSSPDHPFAPTAEHPDRDFFGWPEGTDMPVGSYDNVSESWAMPSPEAAREAAIYDSAERADPSFQRGLSWYAACETCEGPNGPQEVQRGAA